MSSSSITGQGILAEVRSGWSLPRAIIEPIKHVAFWCAIVLPFLYLPLLATGLQSQSIALTFVLLVILNIFTLLIGHPYGSE